MARDRLREIIPLFQYVRAEIFRCVVAPVGDIHRLLHDRTFVRHPRFHRVRPLPECTRGRCGGPGTRGVPAHDCKRRLGSPPDPHPGGIGTFDCLPCRDSSAEGPEVYRFRSLRVPVRARPPDLHPDLRRVPGRGMGVVEVRVNDWDIPFAIILIGKRARSGWVNARKDPLEHSLVRSKVRSGRVPMSRRW